MATSNFDRFSALLTSQQLSAMRKVCEALQDDPTCLDIHHAGFTATQQATDKKEETSNGYC